MTESFSDLRPSWIAFGWFIAAAVASFVVFFFIMLGLLTWDSLDAGGVWTAVAILVGFVVGGFFTGVRVARSPVLHGLAIGLFSLLVFLLANVFAGEPTGATAWRQLPYVEAAALLTLQAVAAIVGTRMGTRWTLR
jgi:hypothetical protein